MKDFKSEVLTAKPKVSGGIILKVKNQEVEIHLSSKSVLELTLWLVKYGEKPEDLFPDRDFIIGEDEI